jgi:lipopolysaccharide export system permease protein
VRLVSTYICREFLRFFCIGLVGCVGLYFLVELFDRVDEFVERHVFWNDAVSYLVFKLPGIVYQFVPAAFLLASVLTFSTLNKGNEMTAMRAGGIAPLRLAWPLFLAGAVGGLVLLAAQEYLLPYTNHLSRLVWRTRIRHEKIATRLGLFKRGRIWYRTADRVWSAQLSNPLENQLLGVTIYVLDAVGTIRQRYDAAVAHWDGQGWVLQQGVLRVFNPDGTFAGPAEEFAQRRLDFPERFIDISALRKQPEEMSGREMLAYARQLRRQGLPAAPFLTEFHGRFAYAAACILMAGFGVPLALRLNRSGGTTRAVGLTVLCGFSYWVVYSIAMALGHNGMFSPVPAAWSTNLCFGTASLYLSYRLQ